MAAVNIQEVEPDCDSVNPAILFHCTIGLQRNREILLACEGSLWCDEKRIGTASVEYEPQNTGPAPRNLALTSGSTGNDTLRATFHVPLTRHALSFLEKYRDESSSGDVELALRCSTRSLDLEIAAHRELIFEPIEPEGEPLEERPSENRFKVKETEYKNNRLLISTGSDYLGRVRTWTYSSGCTISASDWAQEFAPVLGMGNFLLFEYRVPEEVNAQESSLHERLQIASSSLNRMQHHIQRGEWNQAAQEIRRVTELVKEEKDAIAQLLEADDIESDAASHITKGMHEMFGYASKFVHAEDESGNPMPRHKASKEDAYLAYTMGTAVVNLLTAKLKRIEDRPTS